MIALASGLGGCSTPLDDGGDDGALLDVVDSATGDVGETPDGDDDHGDVGLDDSGDDAPPDASGGDDGPDARDTELDTGDGRDDKETTDGDVSKDPPDDGAHDGPDTDDSEVTAPTEPWIRVGTGLMEFEPIEPGRELMMTQGPQGGFHIWGGVEGGGFPPVNQNFEFIITDGAGEIVGMGHGPRTLHEDGDRLVLSGVIVFIEGWVLIVDDWTYPWTMCARLFSPRGEPIAEDCADFVARCCEYMPVPEP